MLVDGRQDLEACEESRQTLDGMVHQISQEGKGYQAAIEEQQASAGDLRSREADLDGSKAELRSDRNRTATRQLELKAAERARIRRSRVATTGGTAGKGYQPGAARDKIVAQAGRAHSHTRVRRILQGGDEGVRVWEGLLPARRGRAGRIQPRAEQRTF